MNKELIEPIVASVLKSLKLLYKEDGDTLIAKDLPRRLPKGIQKEHLQHAAERSIVFRWAYYLNTLLEPTFNRQIIKCQKHPYKIDLEYNRHLFLQKKLDGKIIFPDLIIHRRDTNDNLLIAECKGWWNEDISEIDKDKERLKEITQCNDFKYQLGLFVKFEKKLEDTYANLLWYWDESQREMEGLKELIEQCKSE